ncbi:MAG: hypothetical protein WDN04_13595 [Rhodospirillales bacterium]
MFRTRGHPNLRIFSLIATSLFRRMGVDGARIEIGLRSLHEAPFPPTELPVHPKIAEHFGLSYGGPATRYRYFSKVASRLRNMPTDTCDSRSTPRCGDWC